MSTPTQPAPPTAPATEDSVALEVAIVLAAAGSAALTAAAVAKLVTLLGLLRIPRASVTVVTAVINAVPPADPPSLGMVARDNGRQALLRRAYYLIGAARRVTAAAVGAGSRGEVGAPGRPGAAVVDAVAEAAKREARYWRQHKQAERDRRAAADILDDAAAQHGGLLEWRSRRDGRVTRACQVADGHLFRVDRPPRIGLPGLGGPHHGCRCWPTRPRPWPGQMTVDQALDAAGLTGHE